MPEKNIIEFYESVDAQEWNGRVCSVPEGSYFQSTYFSEYMQGFIEAKPLFILARSRDGRIKGQLLSIEHTEDWGQIKKASYFKLIKRALMGTQYSWFDGPLIFEKSENSYTTKEILDSLIKYRRGKPCLIQGKVSCYGGEVYDEVMGTAGFRRLPAQTILLDNITNEENAWNLLKKDAQAKVRKASKQGIVIHECRNDEDFNCFLTVVKGALTRNNLQSYYHQSRYKVSWDLFRECGVSKYFISKKDAHILSAQMFFFFNKILILGAVSTTDYAASNKLYANDLMQWHIIQWALLHGARVIDWVGCLSKEQSPKADDINYFKLKWGGRIVDQDLYQKTSFKWNIYQGLKQACLFLRKK